MPRGFKGVRRASAAIEAKRQQGGFFGPAGVLYFQLPSSGDEAVVRFLEEDDQIAWCWVHEAPVEGRNFGRDVPCLDQDDEDEPCPGCERELPRKFKGFINLIWFDAPQYKRDKQGKIVKVDGEKLTTGKSDQVAVWTSGPRLFEELDEQNETYHGLRSRRFKVRRKGTGLDTKYVIKPEDIDSGKQGFSAGEKELESSKWDLDEFMKIPTYEEFIKIVDGPVGTFSSGENQQQTQQRTAKVNPFMRERAS